LPYRCTEEFLMTDVTSVPLGPIVSTVAPLLASIGVALLGGAVTWFAARYRAWTHKDMAQADENALKQSINTAAGVIFASAEAGISTQSIHVSDPRIATQVAYIAAFLPALLQQVGVTPDSLSRLILGRLGELQAQSTATAHAIVVESAPVSAPALLAPAKS
jgi:hypothetical protein